MKTNYVVNKLIFLKKYWVVLRNVKHHLRHINFRDSSPKSIAISLSLVGIYRTLLMFKNIKRIIVCDFGITYESFIHPTLPQTNMCSCLCVCECAMNIWIVIPFLFRWPHKTFSIQMLVQMKRCLSDFKFNCLALPSPFAHVQFPLYTPTKNRKQKSNQINRKWTQLNQVNELSEVFECTLAPAWI